VLVLIDGMRFNDPQTGHHNSDIPLSIQDIERIEVLYGPGSSLHGGDALAGTINLITRNDASTVGIASIGEYGLVSGAASVGLSRRQTRTHVSFWGNRSSGFEFGRDFRTAGFSVRSALGSGTQLGAHFVDRDFGANGFYGPSPSREWTNTTLVNLSHRVSLRSGWDLVVRGAYRSHGDHFLWDSNRPGFAENRHRSHGLVGHGSLHWNASETLRLSFGAEGGLDWIRSSSLGDHAYSRQSLFIEMESKLTPRAVIYPGLRYDRYTHFGDAFSPSLSGAVWISETIKLGASAGRAYRIPSFTELFYRDPNHEASTILEPETSLGIESGLDWYLAPNWVSSLTIFNRRETGAIDWVRESETQRWRSTNIHSLSTTGAELDINRVVRGWGTVGVAYTYLQSRTDELQLQSKYVLDYARHSISARGAMTLPAGFSVGCRADYRVRNEGASYFVLDGKIARRFRYLAPFLEVSNALDADYQEIRDVNMPGRWIRVGVEARLR
jgi:iron complex outermembrane receptor protein